MRIYVKNELKGITAEYAAVELARFLPLVNGIEAVENAQDADMVFELSTDGRMADYSYSVKGDGRTVRLLGKTENEVLLAVYLALEKMGVFFDTEGSHTAITGTDITAVKNIDVTVRPVVRLRGIRQHINFPMDISSYRIEDAKEYIRDLARMRMNAITFHPFPSIRPFVLWLRVTGYSSALSAKSILGMKVLLLNLQKTFSVSLSTQPRKRA